jgi:EAL and modified HD-GYP domain-containing signal transduction protein
VLVGLVLAGLAAIVAVVLGVRLQAATKRVAELEAERARLTASLSAREGELAALAPYRETVDSAPDWIWATDGEGRITFSNPVGRALLGHEELVGRRLAELTEGAQDGFSGVVQRRHADGSLRTLDTRAWRAGDGWHGIDRDLTEAVPKRVAIVRRAVVDGRRDVVGYELIGDGSVLESYPPAELIALAGGRPLWLTLDGEVASELSAAVIQLRPDADLTRARRLRESGFTLALDDYSRATELLELAAYVKVHTPGRDDDELRAVLADPIERGVTLVATGVATADEFTRCRVLGFELFEGDFFARPSGQGGGAAASLAALGELTAAEASFEQLERIIGADLGLSVALLHHVNSAFFALPREIETVHEALTLLGSRAVRRWATVVALSSVADTSDQLVALALLRARMCELLGAADNEEDRDRLFTVGLLSAADALLDRPMEEVLETLPLSDEVKGVLLRHEGQRGRVLSTVLRYEQGHFPAGGEPGELAEAYLAALRWADDAGSWLG